MRHLVPEAYDRKPFNCPLMNFYRNILQGNMEDLIVFFSAVILNEKMIYGPFETADFLPPISVSFTFFSYYISSCWPQAVSCVFCLCSSWLINPGTWLFSLSFLPLHLDSFPFKTCLSCTLTHSSPLCTAVLFKTLAGSCPGIIQDTQLPALMQCPALPQSCWDQRKLDMQNQLAGKDGDTGAKEKVLGKSLFSSLLVIFDRTT